jgi:hypothetical protein
MRAPKGIAAEIWQGNHKVLAVQPMYCLGLSPAQVVQMMAEILKACSTELDVGLSKFASKVELHPSLCRYAKQPIPTIRAGFVADFRGCPGGTGYCEYGDALCPPGGFGSD